MFPVADLWVPGHEFFQFFVGRGFAQVWQHAQYQQQVFVGFNTVGLRRFHQRVNNRAGLCTLDTVAEQPVLSIRQHSKGSPGSAMMFSLFQTAIGNDLDPYKYPTWLMKSARDKDLSNEDTVRSLLP